VGVHREKNKKTGPHNHNLFRRVKKTASGRGGERKKPVNAIDNDSDPGVKTTPWDNVVSTPSTQGKKCCLPPGRSQCEEGK